MKRRLGDGGRPGAGFAPARGRGLKLSIVPSSVTIMRVRPRAGAWIETHRSRRIRPDLGVRPRAGAWIETRLATDSEYWVCVRPRAGAWIETLRIAKQDSGLLARPRAGAWIETIGL